MATSNPRTNFTLEAPLMKEINYLAEQEKKSISKIVRELVIEGLEKREDRYLSSIADERDANSKKRIKHADAWK